MQAVQRRCLGGTFEDCEQRGWLAHLLEFQITNEGSALRLLHVVGEVCVLQAEVNCALHALVALGQLLG